MPTSLSLRPTPEPPLGERSFLADPGALALLDWADPDPDDRILLLGPNCLELMCFLIRRGSLDVATLRLPDRPEAHSADLVLIANLVAPSMLTCAVGHARRALAAAGSVIVALPPEHAAALVGPTEALLRASGFARIRGAGSPGMSRLTLLRGELIRAEEDVACARHLALVR